MQFMERRPDKKRPNDGPGPRGVPDVYYTSRVLNSTFRYVKFVKKLRAMEEESRKGEENKLKVLKDQQISDFFIRCDRRALINKVAHRVDICLQSYEEDLKVKRQKLKEMFMQEEERDIRKFVEQAQAGAELIWQEKQERLKFLLEKRRKEHEEKYKDTPLSKCTHVTPCLFKIRAKEAQEVQLYQMREKQARQLAEKEFDKMWYAVTMKEADALATRMEIDAIERYRRDLDCLHHSDQQLESRRIQRQKDREMLKRQQLEMKEQFERDMAKEREDEERKRQARLNTAKEREEAIMQRADVFAKRKLDAKLVDDTWASLAGQGIADEKAKIEYMRKKERELDACNREMIQLKENFEKAKEADEILRNEHAKQRQQISDEKRCQELKKRNHQFHADVVEQIRDRAKAREDLEQKIKDENEYQKQAFNQMDELCKLKAMSNAQIRKRHQQDLLEQIEYNKLLKERAWQEELEQRKKGQLASEQYQAELNRMLTRKFLSDEVHPFLKSMSSGLKMTSVCPCSCPDYCARHCGTDICPRK